MNSRKNKTALILTFMLHLIIVASILIPMVSMVSDTAENERYLDQFIEISFVNGKKEATSASTYISKQTEDVREDLDFSSEESGPGMEEEELTVQNTEILLETENDVYMESEIGLGDAEVKDASEDINVLSDEGSEHVEEGEGELGFSITGKELANMEFEGDGRFGRKVIYHADIARLAEKEGRVVVNLCINRSGRVTHMAFNSSESSLDDPEYVKEVMWVAGKYRFEKDYTAPVSQCGKLSFIFKINR